LSVEGVARTIRGATEDLASATVSFSTGLTATFNTSRLGQHKIRAIEVTQQDSVIIADLVRQDITVHRMSRHEYLTDEGQRYRQSSVIEIPFIEQRGEPLLRELQGFVDNVRDGDPPAVSGADGLRALALAERVAAAVRRS
jgi:predicted dehydrogenase